MPLSVLAEQIDSYHTKIYINKDSSIKVIEEIDYDFGEIERHGIYRDIIYKYKARGGTFKLGLSDINVTDEYGNDYEFSESKSGEYYKIKIGDPDSYVTGKKRYNIEYTVKKAINYFNTHDELYWNAIGTEWDLPILNTKATIYLPQEISSEKLKIDCFIGVSGSTETCQNISYTTSTDNLVSSVVFDENTLNSNQGLTVVVGLPKDIIYQPSLLEIIWGTIKDNIILGLPIIVFLYMFFSWYTKGRDPKGREIIITEFDVPDNLTPAEVGVIVDEKVNDSDISAEIIDLAVKGYLKIQYFDEDKDHELIKIKDGEDIQSAPTKYLFDQLFKKRDTVKLSKLEDKFYISMSKIKREIYQQVVEKGYFKKNPLTLKMKYVGIGSIVAFFLPIAPFVMGFYLASIALFISGIIILIFSSFMPALSKKGVLAKEHILGLKSYLTVAEKDRIKFHNAPEKKPEIFEKLLPLAMVLGVETKWAKQFEGLYNYQPNWYISSGYGTFTSMELANSLSKFSTESTYSMSSSPSSSSSSGGSGFSGGSSGGGGGGGGGGSW